MTKEALNLHLERKHHALWLAINHHRTHKNEPVTFQGYPYLKAIYLDTSPHIVVIKSTQSGLSEYLTVQGISKAMRGRSVFHVLPTGNLRNRYVKNRFDKSVQNTAFYYEMIEDAEDKKRYGRGSESVSLKHVAGGTIAYVGSNSEASMTEFPADDLIVDEQDQCDLNILPMAEERLANSPDPTRTFISNPTIEGYGIDEEYSETDQKRWFIKCPHCGHWQHPGWFTHVVQEIEKDDYVIRDAEFDWADDRDINMVCEKCAKGFQKGVQGEWVRTYSDRRKSGYQISKLFSAKTSIREMMERFSKGLVKPIILQRFYNADLGLAFTAEGAKITEDLLNASLGEHRNGSQLPGAAVMGIDVGSVSNYTIGYVQPTGTILAAEIGLVKTDADEINRLARERGVRLIVIDSRPEGAVVRKLKELFRFTFAAIYTQESMKETVDNYRNVKIDRTTSLDAVKEALIIGKIKLPANAPGIEDFYEQMTAATRIFDPEAFQGQGAYKWTEGSKADHYHHAMNYMHIASRILSLA
jgi:hypothetical protein